MDRRPIFGLEITFVVVFTVLFFLFSKTFKGFLFQVGLSATKTPLGYETLSMGGAPNYTFSYQSIVTMLTFAAKIVSVCMGVLVSVCMRVLVCARACVCLNETEIQEK